eukprot:UN18330
MVCLVLQSANLIQMRLRRIWSHRGNDCEGCSDLKNKRRGFKAEVAKAKSAQDELQKAAVEQAKSKMRI